MNVTWWLNEYPPDEGGIGTLAQLLRPALVARDVHLDFLVVQGGPDVTLDGTTEITRRPIREAIVANDPGALARWLPFVSAYKRDHRADAYHVHLCEPTPILHVMTRTTHPAPTILTLHNEMFRRLTESGPDSLFGRLLEMASVVTTVSSASAREFIEARPDLADRVVVIPNAITIRPEGGPPPEALTILAAGRLVPQKGFDRLLRAMPQVLQDQPAARLTIAGDGSEGPALLRLAEKLGVREAVDFVGHVDREQVRVAMESSRIVVIPSRFEGMPLVALEAAERGRCVVGADIGGINEVVVHDRTGILVDADAIDDDATILASAVVAALCAPGRAEDLGAAARARVAGAFSIESCARTYRQVYEAVAGSAPRPRISVIIPAWNADRHVSAAVQSVLDQTYGDLEIIVVDDGSDDGTIDALQAIDDPRLIVLAQPHRGIGASRNAAIALARGEFLAHLDADDLWPEHRLEHMLAVLDERQDLDACFGSGVEFRDHDAPERVQVVTTPQPVRMPTTALIRTRAHRRVGPFGSRPYGDQLDWAMRALQSGLAYAQIDDVVLRRRVHATNNSHKYPFIKEKGRIALIKLALDRKRREQA